MYSGSKHLTCTIIYFAIVSSKGVISENGDHPKTGDTTVDILTVNTVNRSELLLNDTKANLASSTTSLNFSNATVTIHSLSIGGCSDGNIVKNKRPINNIRDDYTLIQDVGIYKLQKRKLAWYSAYKACIEENAHLVVINSLKEADALGQLMIGHEDVRSAYIGAHDMFLEGEWITVHGESLKSAGFNVWAPGEPNNAKDNENCAVLRKTGTMNDVACSFEWYYICEIPL